MFDYSKFYYNDQMIALRLAFQTPMEIHLEMDCVCCRNPFVDERLLRFLLIETLRMRDGKLADDIGREYL